MFDHEHQHDSQWATIWSVADKIGCTAETLRHWVRQAERDVGRCPGLSTEERARMKEREREVRRANEILRKASAFFAQAELDRRPRQWWPSSTRSGRRTGVEPMGAVLPIAPATYFRGLNAPICQDGRSGGFTELLARAGSLS